MILLLKDNKLLTAAVHKYQTSYHREDNILIQHIILNYKDNGYSDALLDFHTYVTQMQTILLLNAVTQLWSYVLFN